LFKQIKITKLAENENSISHSSDIDSCEEEELWDSDDDENDSNDTESDTDSIVDIEELSKNFDDGNLALFKHCKNYNDKFGNKITFDKENNSNEKKSDDEIVMEFAFTEKDLYDFSRPICANVEAEISSIGNPVNMAGSTYIENLSIELGYYLVLFNRLVIKRGIRGRKTRNQGMIFGGFKISGGITPRFDPKRGGTDKINLFCLNSYSPRKVPPFSPRKVSPRLPFPRVLGQNGG
jgi:hypothetical protein